MSITKLAAGLPRYALEPLRLQKVLSAAPYTQSDIINEVRLEMNHIAAHSVLEALRPDKKNAQRFKGERRFPVNPLGW